MSRVVDVLRDVRGRLNPHPELVPAALVPGSELVHLGGGEMVPTPGVPELPLLEPYRHDGLGGESLALPPANVRILNDVQIVLGERVVRTPSGAVVAESVASARVGSLPRHQRGSIPSTRPGSAAPYGTPGGGAFEGLVESLPRALLLQHPALRRWAPISLLCEGGAPPVEAWLLDRLDPRMVRLVTLGARAVVEARHTVVAAPVTRAGAGAITRWYRRWLDDQAAAVGSVDGAPLPRRLVLVHGGHDPMHGVVLPEAGHDRPLVVLDTSTGNTSSGPALDGAGIVAALHHAELIVGASDDALGHVALCRRARVVQVGVSELITPRVLQLAESRALPHTFVRPHELHETLRN